MQRELSRLSDNLYDLLIIGGGIYGACVAWDAVLRGLSVALIEQGDFGHATSANSQKIIHGGFRYLQSLDLKRMRESIRERRHLLRIAPHLTQPLPFLLPTYRTGIQRRDIMRAALWTYDAISADRNMGVSDPAKWIPASRIISREECLRLAPGIDAHELTGGVIWYDGQIYNSERLTLAFIQSAEECGACVANYVRVTDVVRQGNRVTGARAVDLLSGRTLEIRSRLVLNTSGPWINQILAQVSGPRADRRVRFVKTINVVTRSLTNHQSVSVLIPHEGGAEGHVDGCCRRIHITPWRGCSIVGSLHVQTNGSAQSPQVNEAEIAQLLANLRRAYPGAALTPRDVRFVHAGLLPAEETGPQSSRDGLSDHYDIRDHQLTDGIGGVVSVVGVKYTTARDVAEKAITLALRKLGYRAKRSLSATTPLWGGRIDRMEEFVAGALRTQPHGLEDDVIRQLISSYGSEYPEVLREASRASGSCERVDPASSVIKAQVIFAVREEMAWTLRDVVFRRTELGSLGHPGRNALRTCAQLMASELGWSAEKIAREIDGTEQAFTEMGVVRPEVEVVT